MNLSMWILADHLKKYQPVLHIEEGTRVLQNVRLLTTGARLSQYTLYLSRLDEERVACMNGHDMIQLRHGDLDELLDEMLDIFEYYNEWQNHIQESIADGCSAGNVLRQFSELTGYCYILADATFYVLEKYGDETVSKLNLQTGKILQDRILPVECLLRINSNPKIRLEKQPSYLIEQPEIESSSCVTNLFSRHRHKGWLIALNQDNAFSRGYMDIQDAMGTLLQLWLDGNQDTELFLEKADVFLEILNGDHSGKGEILRRLAGFSWYEYDVKCIYQIILDTEGDVKKYALDRTLERRISGSFVFRFQDCLFLLANYMLVTETTFDQELLAFLRHYHCHAAKGTAFTDIFQLSMQVKKVQIIAKYAREQSQGLTTMQDIMLPYWLHVLKMDGEEGLRHPAPGQLKKYDTDHGTELYRTLFEFLKQERNYKTTANNLCIHRSTLSYRLERIWELTKIDLEQFETRMQILLTFLLDAE